ncbi:MAG: PLD nuclease N-terminal domain-containing protein [Dehalococcoidia bacterium]|nr:PLD nuclease N-terminal domain-containing protein [Dehalococcoidia bacterium]
MPDTTYLGMSLGAFILMLIPIAILEYGLMIWALVDVIRREYVRGNKKIVWILVIVLVGIIGPIVYFLVGRADGSEEIEKG